MLKSVHLSDYADSQTHLFIGEGYLDFPGLFQIFETVPADLTITLECSMSTRDKPAQEMTKAELLARLIEAKKRLDGFLEIYKDEFKNR